MEHEIERGEEPAHSPSSTTVTIDTARIDQVECRLKYEFGTQPDDLSPVLIRGEGFSGYRKRTGAGVHRGHDLDGHSPLDLVIDLRRASTR